MHFSMLDIIVEKEAKMLSFCSIQYNGVDDGSVAVEAPEEEISSMFSIGVVTFWESRSLAVAFFGVTVINYTWAVK